HPVTLVAEHFDVSEWSARRWLRDAGLRPPPRDPSAPLNEAERKAILDQYDVWTHSVWEIVHRVGLPHTLVPMIREFLAEARPRVKKVKPPVPEDIATRIR